MPAYLSFSIHRLPYFRFLSSKKMGPGERQDVWTCRHQLLLCCVCDLFHLNSFPPSLENTVWIANGSWEGRSEAEAWWVDVGRRNGINHAENAVAARTLGLQGNFQPPTSTAHMWSIHGDGNCREQTEAVNWLNVNINIASVLARWTVWEIRLFFLPFSRWNHLTWNIPEGTEWGKARSKYWRLWAGVAGEEENSTVSAFCLS